MKDKIKSILREGVIKNSLGITVTRPDQELIVMRGIPGGGKSTKAKQLVGNGVIHSTDDIIEKNGDYGQFFANMMANNDFSPLNRAHKSNFQNAVTSMKNGVNPVIIDNTNIRANESKNYVEAALNLGYDNNNIKFVEIGTGGLSAEELAQRNTHGVPLDKIKSMIQAYQSAGPMTLQKVLDAKPIQQQKIFASLVLDDNSKSKLLSSVSKYIPEGWEVIVHHMTINFGKGLPGNLKGDLGKVKSITATEIGISDMAIAVKVDGYHSDNKISHITIAINPNGGKAVMSNDITNWKALDTPITLSGVVTEETLK